jgi:hypothetical protein
LKPKNAKSFEEQGYVNQKERNKVGSAVVFTLIVVDAYEIEPENSGVHTLVINHYVMGMIVYSIIVRVCSYSVDDGGWVTDDEQGCH